MSQGIFMVFYFLLIFYTTKILTITIINIQSPVDKENKHKIQVK